MIQAANTYNTNLASEFLVMSLMHRAGKEAYLSLGNKKGVDVLVKTEKGNMCVLEVKGVNKRDDWLIGNTGVLPSSKELFYVLVCYHGKIKELPSPADFWLIPSEVLVKSAAKKVSKNRKTVYVWNKFVRENYDQYKNNIEVLETYLRSS